MILTHWWQWTKLFYSSKLLTYTKFEYKSLKFIQKHLEVSKYRYLVPTSVNVVLSIVLKFDCLSHTHSLTDQWSIVINDHTPIPISRCILYIEQKSSHISHEGIIIIIIKKPVYYNIKVGTLKMLSLAQNYNDFQLHLPRTKVGRKSDKKISKAVKNLQRYSARGISGY